MAGVVGANSLVASRVLLEVLEAMEGVLELMYFVVVMHVVEEAFGEEVEIVPGWSFRLGLTRVEGVKLSLDVVVCSAVGVGVALVLVVPCKLAHQQR